MFKDDALEMVSDLNRTVIIESVVAMLQLGRAHAESYRQMAEATDAHMDALDAKITQLTQGIDVASKEQMKGSVKSILTGATDDWKAALNTTKKN